MFIFCVKAGHEIQLLSYGSKHSSQFLSDKSFVRPSTHNLKTTGYKWTFSILTDCSTIETFLVWFRVAREIQLESYCPRHASAICVYCKPVYTSLFGMQLSMPTKLTYLMTVYYTPNDGFTANNASFYKRKFG